MHVFEQPPPWMAEFSTISEHNICIPLSSVGQSDIWTSVTKAAQQRRLGAVHIFISTKHHAQSTEEKLTELCAVAEDVAEDRGIWSVTAVQQSPAWSLPALSHLIGQHYKVRINMDMFGVSAYTQWWLASNTKRLVRLARTQSCTLQAENSQAHESIPSVPRQYAQELDQHARKRYKLTCTWPADDDAVRQKTFATRNDQRKRPLGRVIRDHEAHPSAPIECSAGLQRKRSRMPPLINEELEPGNMVRQSLKITHPFTPMGDNSDHTIQAAERLIQDPQAVISQRRQLLRQWSQFAEQTRMEALHEIRELPSEVRNIHCHGRKWSEHLQTGQFVHFPLWRAMAKAANALDQHYIEEFKTGLHIVGPVQKSMAWPPMESPEPMTLEEYHKRAWVVKKNITSRIRKKGVGTLSQSVWDDTVKDREAGYCSGPFTEREVTEIVGPYWVPTERFPVEQKNKVRCVDSATTSLVNELTKVTEKLQIGSAERNITTIRVLAKSKRPLTAWVADESKAYRQVPVHPRDKQFAVITILDPSTGLPTFWIMHSHSFGWTSAVYNYNRRSRLFNEILTNLFGLPASFYYDDKFGFELMETLESAVKSVKFVHTALGARLAEDKHQSGQQVEILGVQYDLKKLVLRITAKRRRDLINEIGQIIHDNSLTPAAAAKLKGKLSFAATTLWGKVGRAFLLAISERQYSAKQRKGLDSALTSALTMWVRLIAGAKPRQIYLGSQKPADYVLFTDGFAPDPERGENGIAGIGGVLFQRKPFAAKYFSAEVRDDEIAEWLPRKNQIAMIELLGVVKALVTFDEVLAKRSLIVFTDSEVVEGALIKGYSSRSDVCHLVGLFWEIVSDLETLVYVTRVSTDANIADTISRHDMSVAHACGWTRVTMRELKGLGRLSYKRR